MKLFRLNNVVIITGLMLSSVIPGWSAESGGTQPKKNRSLLVLPVVFYSPETRWGGGTGGVFTFRSAQRKESDRPSFIPFKILYTQNKQCEISLEPELYFKDGDLVLCGKFSFKRFPERFFGIGNDDSQAVEEDYTPQNISINLSLQKRVIPKRNLFAGLALGYDSFRLRAYEPGGELESGTIPGFQGGTISGLGGFLRWDRRDNVFFPRRGISILLSAEWNSAIFGSDFDYVKAVADLRIYIPVFRSHVLAFQGLFQGGSGDVPFMTMPRLGGEKLLRGVPSGRYRDKVMTAFQAEYRLPVFWRLGLVGFASLGSVSDRFLHLDNTKWRFSGGWGIRFKLSPSEGLNLRIDFGYGQHSSGVYITAAEAF